MLRVALVTGLGYPKLSNELSVTKVDRWQNYLLIRINVSEDFKLCYLLEINVSTAKIDCAIEIPYDLPTVTEAANSINWDIFSPELGYPEYLKIDRYLMCWRSQIISLIGVDGYDYIPKTLAEYYQDKSAQLNDWQQKAINVCFMAMQLHKDCTKALVE